MMGKNSNIEVTKNPSPGGAGAGRLRWLAGLMGLAILGVTGFQLYWLKENYAREKKSLGIKTEVTFRETIMQLQVAKLRLEDVNRNEKKDKPGVRVFMTSKDDHIKVNRAPGQEIVSTINVIRGKLKDSLRLETKSGMIIATNKSDVDFHGDTMKFRHTYPGLPGYGNHILDLLYGVDSLRDTLTLKEIIHAFESSLKDQKLVVPFTITRLDTACENEEPVPDKVTIGFAKPVTYQLELGNTFPYLLRQLTQPILFSILLLGITILSFVLLYRNLLRQQRLAALKNEFISNITHELKTPIATVGVAIEALRNFNAMQDPQKTKEYLDISQNELHRLSLLVDKVLKLSMFEKKEIALKYESLNLDELVREVETSLKLQLEKYHAQLTVASEGDTTLQGDRLHLLSVIFNLLDNALKYGNGNTRIAIGITGKQDAVVLTVADNGVGIPAEYKNRIFEKFFRVPHGDMHNAKGYGLGLSYVAQVIHKHKGEISVDSQPGAGTTFTIILPKQHTDT